MTPSAITIYGELHSSKNGMQIVPNKGKGKRPFYLLKKEVARQADTGIELQLRVHSAAWRALIDGRPYPIGLRFKIYRQTRRRFDYVNIVQSLLDCMVRVEWLADDDANHIIPIFDRYEVDSKNPRVELSITEAIT